MEPLQSSSWWLILVQSLSRVFITSPGAQETWLRSSLLSYGSVLIPVLCPVMTKLATPFPSSSLQNLLNFKDYLHFIYKIIEKIKNYFHITLIAVPKSRCVSRCSLGICVFLACPSWWSNCISITWKAMWSLLTHISPGKRSAETPMRCS